MSIQHPGGGISDVSDASEVSEEKSLGRAVEGDVL